MWACIHTYATFTNLVGERQHHINELHRKSSFFEGWEYTQIIRKSVKSPRDKERMTTHMSNMGRLVNNIALVGEAALDNKKGRVAERRTKSLPPNLPSY